ncbi:MAG: class I SAM-dependent methyltransferase [Verrucomicrobia bacterium]|nr:class I SAM-dependent methyltransferase [Verrucomicrobiota bacterium]
MEVGQPSRTARSAAIHRAVHQVLEQGRIFKDPLAFRILGEEPGELVREAERDPGRRRMRLFIAVRTRFAEDAFGTGAAMGVRQLVILGAGLDTFAYRQSLGPEIRVFEVDHPATQAWKKERLSAAAISIPDSLIYAPIDFERQTLADSLAAAGFDRKEPAFFTWLGVVPYLTEDAVWTTLAAVASLPSDTQVVFDYSNPAELLSPESRERHDERAGKVAELGEPWITFFETDGVRAKLQNVGFSEIEDLGPREISERYLPNRTTTSAEHGGHVVRAAKKR